MANNTGVFRQKINSKITSNNKKEVSASSVREVLTDAADAIDEIFETFSLNDGVGTLNATTLVGTISETGATTTLTATPNQPDGKFYILKVAGSLTITAQAITSGIPESGAIGGYLVSRGTKWDYIPPADTGYAKVLKLEQSFPENIYKDIWAFVWLTISGRNFGGFEIDGAWNALKYKIQSIPGTALKNATITYDKLHANVISAFATVAQLTPYEAAKNRFPTNPNPIDYAFPVVDLLGRMIAHVKHDGTLVWDKFKYNLAGMLVALAPIIQPRSGEKMVTLGDSITEGRKWQPLLAKILGLVWSEEETLNGVGGNPAMGIGGSAIVPILRSNGSGGYTSGRGPGQSIYMRAGFVHLYSPKVIILWGGANDPLTESTWGSPTDAPYTGGEIPEGDASTPTFCAAYNGTLKKLIDNNPNARIIVKTRMFATNINSNNELAYQKLNSFNNLIRGCAERQGIPVIDAQKDYGIWSYNASTYIPDGVHPDVLGGIRIAQADSKKVY